MRLDPAQQHLVAPPERAGEAVGVERAERKLLHTPHALEVLGHLGHGLAEPLRVLLGDEHGQAEHPRPPDERGHAPRDAVEVEYRRPEALLDVDHRERRAAPVELHRRAPRPAKTVPSASRIAKPRSRYATVPAATVISTRPFSSRPAKHEFSERLS